MKKLTSYSKRVKYTYVKTTLVTIFVSLFFLKGYTAFEKTGENYFHVFLNGTEIGTVGEADRAEQLLQEARRNIASQSEDMIFIDADLKLVGEEALWGTLTGEDTMLAAMERELESSIRETSHRSYTMKVNEYMVNLSSVDEVKSLLQAAVDKYDSEEKFSVELTHDAQKEFNVLTTEVVNRQELTAQEEQILFFCQFRKRFLFLLFLIKLPAVFKSTLLCLKALAVCIQLGEPHFQYLELLVKNAFLLLQLFHRLVPFFFKSGTFFLQTMHFFQQQFFCNPYFIFIRFLHKIRHVFFPSGLINLPPVSIHRKTDCIPITITVRSEQSLPACFRSADRAICQVLPQNSRCRVSFSWQLTTGFLL